ncbi:MAG: reverse transcriptase-like protein [Candidatus Saccharimonadales bacterium]
MKKLKFNHTLAKLILEGKKTSTWRLFDDKDISVDDQVVFVDKVDPKDPKTWRNIGSAIINNIVQKRLRDITYNDIAEQEQFSSKEAMLKTFQKYYGTHVAWETPVKIIEFSFSSDIPITNTKFPVFERVVIYADGGSRGNPGPSASGFVIFNDQNKILINKGVYLGITTNNQAEYTSLKLALEEAKKLGAKRVSVYMDSLLVINQMKGIFKIKNRDLWPIYKAAQQLSGLFKHIEFTQVPRELNKLADAAVNKALDEELNRGSRS